MVEGIYFVQVGGHVKIPFKYPKFQDAIELETVAQVTLDIDCLLNCTRITIMVNV